MLCWVSPAWGCSEATSMSLPWRMASACGRRQSCPRAWLGVSPEAGPAVRMQEDISSLEMSLKLSRQPGDLQGFGTSPAPALPMDISWAKAMSTPGLFMQTETICWGNMNGFFWASENNFNITPFFWGKCRQLAPKYQELDFVVSRISSVSV